MKKFVYLCGIMLLSMNIRAQIEIDNNWIPVIDDNFHDFQGWNDYFKEIDRYPGYERTWECFSRELFTGITETNKYQAYQKSHAYLSVDNKMTLKAEYKSSTPLLCGVDYTIPLGKECTGEAI